MRDRKISEVWALMPLEGGELPTRSDQVWDEALPPSPHSYPGVLVPWPLSRGLTDTQVLNSQCLTEMSPGRVSSVPLPLFLPLYTLVLRTASFSWFFNVTSFSFSQAQSCVVSKVKTNKQTKISPKISLWGFFELLLLLWCVAREENAPGEKNGRCELLNMAKWILQVIIWPHANKPIHFKGTKMCLRF